MVGPNGLTDFEALRRRGSGDFAVLYAFDLLEYDGSDLRRMPLETRKATLASLLKQSDVIRFSEHIAAEGLPRLAFIASTFPERERSNDPSEIRVHGSGYRTGTGRAGTGRRSYERSDVCGLPEGSRYYGSDEDHAGSDESLFSLGLLPRETRYYPGEKAFPW